MSRVVFIAGPDGSAARTAALARFAAVCRYIPLTKRTIPATVGGGLTSYVERVAALSLVELAAATCGDLWVLLNDDRNLDAEVARARERFRRSVSGPTRARIQSRTWAGWVEHAARSPSRARPHTSTVGPFDLAAALDQVCLEPAVAS